MCHSIPCSSSTTAPTGTTVEMSRAVVLARLACGHPEVSRWNSSKQVSTHGQVANEVWLGKMIGLAFDDQFRASVAACKYLLI